MKYDISKNSSPKMPNLGRGTECIKILLSQVSKDMRKPLVPMLFPVLGAHVSGTEFQYPDLTWKETCGMMANLVADSGCNKGQLSNLVEAICRDIWSKMQLFADILADTDSQADGAQRRGPKNMLDSLPDTFNETQRGSARAARKVEGGHGAQLRKWLFRKFITYSDQTGLYTKTEEYLK